MAQTAFFKAILKFCTTNKLKVMPVLMSAASETKLLGIPLFTLHSGITVSNVVAGFAIYLLEDWNYSADEAISMAFDTTSANTGLWTRSCFELQSRSNKPLLWCVSMKHIGKLIAEKMFDALTIEKFESPESKLFENFFTSFGNIPQSNFCFPPYFVISCDISENILLFLKSSKKEKVTLAVKLSNRDVKTFTRRPQELLKLLLFNF